jgi:hypothetical protein
MHFDFKQTGAHDLITLFLPAEIPARNALL